MHRNSVKLENVCVEGGGGVSAACLACSAEDQQDSLPPVVLSGDSRSPRADGGPCRHRSCLATRALCCFSEKAAEEEEECIQLVLSSHARMSATTARPVA